VFDRKRVGAAPTGHDIDAAARRARGETEGRGHDDPAVAEALAEAFDDGRL
jgi:hypothetical protein